MRKAKSQCGLYKQIRQAISYPSSPPVYVLAEFVECHVVISVEKPLVVHVISHVTKQRREWCPFAYPSDHALRAREDLAHLLHLVVPLFSPVLVDTQSINP
jgi:hypothetical protein